MQKSIAIFALTFFWIVTTQVFAQDGMVIMQSEYSVDETTERLETILKNNGLKIFETVDHRKGAASVNLDLPPTTVIIFGNPKLGTPLMQCAPTTAIDLPQKILVWKNEDGKVKVGYNSPNYLKMRHNIEGCDQKLQKISGALQKFTQSATQKK